jgi:G:T-mismatch repair DNA endonuclease (very short patch repair protein)
MIVHCAECGSEKDVETHYYEKSKSKRFFCNSECKSKWQSSDKNPLRKNKIKVCLECGKDFDLRKTHASEKQRFCSSKCYGNYAKKNPGVLQPIQPQKRYTKKCKCCGKEFWLHAHRTNTIFCSSECHNEYRRETKECPTCNSLFTSPKHEKRKYCSSDCAKHNKIRQSAGEKEIFDFLTDVGLEVKSNVPVKFDKGFYKPDILVDNKIIEFYGTYWHCHESLFSETDYNSSIGMTATEKRDFDSNRIIYLQSIGYHVMIIWEHEWNKDKEAVKKDILSFLKG